MKEQIVKLVPNDYRSYDIKFGETLIVYTKPKEPKSTTPSNLWSAFFVGLLIASITLCIVFSAWFAWLGLVALIGWGASAGEKNTIQMQNLGTTYQFRQEDFAKTIDLVSALISEINLDKESLKELKKFISHLAEKEKDIYNAIETKLIAIKGSSTTNEEVIKKLGGKENEFTLKGWLKEKFEKKVDLNKVKKTEKIKKLSESEEEKKKETPQPKQESNTKRSI